MSAGVKHSVRTRNGGAYEKTTLQVIAQDVARCNKMELVGKFETLQIQRAHRCLRAIWPFCGA